MSDSVVYPSNPHVLVILCDVGGGAPLAWYESLDTGRYFSFPIVLPVPESSPPPVNWPGLLTHAVSDDRDPQW